MAIKARRDCVDRAKPCKIAFALCEKRFKKIDEAFVCYLFVGGVLMMEFRRITETDRAQVEELWDYCFEKREEPFFQYYFQHYCFEQNVVWGAFEEGKLQSMLHLSAYTLAL